MTTKGLTPEAATPLPEERFFREVNIEFLIHELKDPLSVIESNAQLLLTALSGAPAQGDQHRRSLERIVRNAQRARSMLWDLLEVGRAENACFQCRAFTAAEMVGQVMIEVVESHGGHLRDTLHEQKNQKARLKKLAEQGLRLDVAPAAEELTIFHDEVKFRHIVANLIKNALSYHRRRVIVHLGCAQEQIMVAVRDDGPGIAPQHHAAIFDRYKQVRPAADVARSGHGLGLAVARILARTMGGDIVLESQLGEGALFRLALPLRMVIE